MKLVSCHIENYGNITDKNFEFDGSLTSFCERNGYGKTTLASFIKAMFYGLPASRANSKEFDDRQHYYPFGGGKFGGNLTFEKDGQIYRVERFFDKKSAVKDTFNLYAGTSIQNVPSDNFGKDIFGLDEQSFLRTVFISSAETEVSATGSINAKLNNFVDDTDENNNFERACDALDKAKKSLKAGRGGGGKIPAQKEKILYLKDEIRNLERISEGLGEKYSEREKLVLEISNSEKEKNSASENNLILQRWETYETYLSEAEAENVKLVNYKAKYPFGAPNTDEVAELEEYTKTLSSYKDKLSATDFSAEKRARLDSLDKTFNGGIPDEQKLKEVQESILKAVKLEGENPEGKFALGIPDEQTLSLYGNKLTELKEKKNGAKNFAVSDEKPKKKSLLIILSAVLAVVLIASGLGLLFVQMIAGIILIVLGLLAGGGFVCFKAGTNGRANSSAELGLQAEINSLENEIRSFLAKYGVYTSDGAEVDFNNFLRDLAEYKTACENSAERDKINAGVREFLSSYGETSYDLQEGLTALKTSCAEYVNLLKESGEVEQKTRNLKEGILQNREKINAILGKYKLMPDGDLDAFIKGLSDDAREIDRLTESKKALDKKAGNFKAEHSLVQKPVCEKIDTAELSERLSSLYKQRSGIDRIIEADEADVEKLQDKKNELERETELLNEYSEKYDLISKALTSLEEAEQKLKDKYVAPIRDKFLIYSSALEKALGEKIFMDKDYRVFFERGGEIRSEKHLSTGQRNLCALCLRLALIDNMYQDETPFIIMDDPFVNLDKEHMSKAGVLIKQLSQNRQIIYFCCHESRLV